MDDWKEKQMRQQVAFHQEMIAIARAALTDPHPQPEKTIDQIEDTEQWCSESENGTHYPDKNGVCRIRGLRKPEEYLERTCIEHLQMKVEFLRNENDRLRKDLKR